MTDENSPKRRRRRRRRGGGGDDARPESSGSDTPRKARSTAPPADESDRGGARRRRRPRRSQAPGSGPGERTPPRPERERTASRPDRERTASRPDRESSPRPPLSRADFVSDDVDTETDDERFVADSDEDESSEPIVLGADLPVEPSDDPDPVSVQATAEYHHGPVHDLVGVKFSAGGKIYMYDSAGTRYSRGEAIVVESDDGPRIGVVAADTQRRSHARKQLKRALRRPNDDDRARQERAAASTAKTLQLAKDIARRHQLPIKVFRVDAGAQGRTVLYFSSESKVDARLLVRDVAKELGGRVDTRQTGVRDEAKLVGGIGSCGQELCCTTWLPAFVPVSIKNAKDQGLVLNPTKVSGQCGRLKCCLVYEHATYAEMRKGLPKLGKRVVTEDGEGRVVEVDVLRQRIRVSLVDGPVKVYGKGEVEPLFPSQQPKASKPPRTTD